MKAFLALKRMLVTVIAFITIVGSTVFGQELAGRIATTTGSLPATSMSMFQDPTHTSDVFFGTDSKGPYTLSWKPINKFSEQITIDNHSVQRGLDYSFDYASGTVTFVQPVASNQTIRASYRCDFATAVQNQTTASTPISLDVLKNDQSNLKFTSLYKSGPTNSKSGPNLAVIGLAGNTKVAGVGVSTMFLTSPVASGQSEGDVLARSAMSLSGSTKAGALELKSSFSRVGGSFENSSAYNLKQGMQAIDFAAKLSATKTLNIMSSYNRSDTLSGDNRGQATTTMAQGMEFTPQAGSKLALTHTQVDSDTPGASANATTTNRIDLAQTLGSRASATASHEDVDANSGGIKTRAVTDQVSLDAHPTDKVSLRSQFVEKNTTDGSSHSLNVNVNATPVKSLSLSAGMLQSDTTAAGHDNTQTFSLSANPDQRLKIDFNAKHEDAEASGSQVQQSLHLVSAPVTNWKLEYAMAGTDFAADNQKDTSSQAVNVSTTLIKRTTVQLNWSQNDSQATGGEEFAGVRVESSPISVIKVTGALGQKTAQGNLELDREAGVELAPVKQAKLGGAYKEVEKDGATVARITEVKATGNPVDFFSVSGAYKTRQQTGQDDVNSMNVAVQVAPGSILALTGAYTVNPEDSTGAVQKVNSQSVKVQSNLGIISVKGGFTQKQDYLAGTRHQLTEVGLDYRLTSKSLLTTSYSIEDQRDVSDLQTSVYALTFSHKVGGNLSISLSGKATLYERDQNMLWDQAAYEGEASLGLKF